MIRDARRCDIKYLNNENIYLRFSFLIKREKNLSIHPKRRRNPLSTYSREDYQDFCLWKDNKALLDEMEGLEVGTYPKEF